MIQVRDLHKTYYNGKNTFEALRGINFDIQKGETVAIVGKSGSGKSTLMHIMAGLDKPTSGDVLYDGMSLKNMDAKELAMFRNQRIGFVFQQFFLQPNLNCRENVVLPLKIRGISKRERNLLADKALN